MQRYVHSKPQTPGLRGPPTSGVGDGSAGVASAPPKF